MTYHFCAQFDRHYAGRALVLYRSLVAHCEEFRLHAYCMDQTSEEAFRRLRLPYMNVVPLSQLELEDRELLKVKQARSLVEYLWTVTPAICLHALQADPTIDMITHLDADLEFYADPAPLFAELGDGSVLLSPDRWSPDFQRSRRARWYTWFGRFTVEFEVFRRDQSGVAALEWWRERCLEWCSVYPERGRFGDQKYLDEMPLLFEGIRESSHGGAGMAARNFGQFEAEYRNGGIYINGTPLIYYHFQSLECHRTSRLARLLAKTTGAYEQTQGAEQLVWTTGWRPSQFEMAFIWAPYVARLSSALADVHSVANGSVLPDTITPRGAAFQVLRRRVPGRLRDGYQYGRAALTQLRGRQRSRGPNVTARSASTSAGKSSRSMSSSVKK